jgi:hypothetical protein
MAIATSMAILGAAALGAAGSVAAGAIGANAAGEAARVQAESADKALGVQQKANEQARADAMPWLKAGEEALNQYMGELGLSEEAKAGTFESQFQKTPGYDFQVSEGEKGVVGNLAALGMRKSGAALKALTRFRQGLADQSYGNYLTRVGDVAGMGKDQVNTTNALSINSANNQASTIQDAGAARASGYVGAANSWSNALAGVSKNAANALGAFAYQPNALNFTPGAGNLY